MIRKQSRLLILVSLLLLTSCGPKLTDASLAKVEIGMSAKQVEKLLGKPDDTHDEHVLGFTGTTLTYHAKPGDVKIVLINDKVISKTGQAGSN
jgi:hypothetical protein